MKQALYSKIYRLSNESIAMLSHRINESVILSEIEEALNGKQCQIHIGVSNRFKAAIEPRNQQLLTKEINKSHSKRNELFSSIFEYAKGQLNSPDEELKAAAAVVFGVLNMYGRYFGNLKIAEQSIRYIRIIEALKKTELASDLLKLHLTEKVVELENAQHQYEDMYMGRANRRLGLETASDIRSELNNAIKLHIEELQWMAKQSDSEPLKTLSELVISRVREISVSVSRTKATAATSDTTENLQSA